MLQFVHNSSVRIEYYDDFNPNIIDAAYEVPIFEVTATDWLYE